MVYTATADPQIFIESEDLVTETIIYRHEGEQKRWKLLGHCRCGLDAIGTDLIESDKVTILPLKELGDRDAVIFEVGNRLDIPTRPEWATAAEKMAIMRGKAPHACNITFEWLPWVP